jgi:hypothetical protein
MTCLISSEVHDRKNRLRKKKIFDSGSDSDPKKFFDSDSDSDSEQKFFLTPTPTPESSDNVLITPKISKKLKKKNFIAIFEHLNSKNSMSKIVSGNLIQKISLN